MENKKENYVIITDVEEFRKKCETVMAHIQIFNEHRRKIIMQETIERLNQSHNESLKTRIFRKKKDPWNEENTLEYMKDCGRWHYGLQYDRHKYFKDVDFNLIFKCRDLISVIDCGGCELMISVDDMLKINSWLDKERMKAKMEAHLYFN